MFTSYAWDERDRIFKRLNKLLPKRIVVSMHSEFHGSTTNGVSCMGVTKHTKKLCCLNFLLFYPWGEWRQNSPKNEKNILIRC